MREMKDSGVEWIGEIPATWEVRKVKSILNLQTGFTPETKNDAYYSDDGVDWVTIGDLNGNKYIPSVTRKKISKTYIELFSPEITPAGSLLYSFKLSVGQTAFTDRPVYTNEAIASFFETGNYSMQFLRFASFLIKYNANTNIYGAHLLNQDLIKNALLVVPSLREQSIIADFLNQKSDQIDTLIQNVQTQIEKLRAYKQSLITEVVTKGLDPTVPMKDSGVDWIGEIPEKWQMRKANTLSERIVVGVVIRPSEYFDIKGTIPFLRGLNVKDYQISTENLVYITEQSNQLLSKSIVNEGDILIVRDGNIGASCIVPPELAGANVVSMIIFTPNSEITSPYICYCLNSLVGKHQFELTKIGSALTHTSVSAVSRLVFPLPAVEEQNSITAYLDKKCAQIDRLIAIKQAKIEKLEQYKRSLIYEYVTGKKEVV